MIKIYAVHGFLGLSSDWDVIGQEIEMPFEALDVFSVSHPKLGLQQWGRALNSRVAKDSVEKRILLGYSQGGRLAMHALLENPELWSGAIIVSANTGIEVEKRAPRLQVDVEWAQRFLSDGWEEVIYDWNNQAVFQGQAPSFCRHEKDYSRTDLADALVGWSVGKQEDLREPLSKLPFPVLWVAGEKDLKYVDLAKRMSAYWIAPGAGHRVPWECSKLFVSEIKAWLEINFLLTASS